MINSETIKNLRELMRMKEELEAEITAAQDQIKAAMTAADIYEYAGVRKSVAGERGLDSSRYELKELISIVELVTDALTRNDVNKVEPEDIDTALNSLFVIRRELQRISDDIGEVVED